MWGGGQWPFRGVGGGGGGKGRRNYPTQGQTASVRSRAYPLLPRIGRANGAARADLIDFDPRVAVVDTSFHIMPRACARPAAPAKVGPRPPARNRAGGSMRQATACPCAHYTP